VVEIVYAEPQRTLLKRLSLPQGARVADALLLAAGDVQLSGVDLGRATLGIHGQVVQREQILRDGDRIEIYRPLAQDPKTARRKRAGRNRA
jgi:putative ubiquitin-RnfH superfamily antitoxin RatB of RatAB toxin-antitoxin module